VLPQSKLEAHRQHVYEQELAGGVTASHVRLNIFPDGGVSRFRLFGTPTPASRRAAVLRQLNAMDDPERQAVLADFCAAPEWIQRVAAARPYGSADEVFAASDAGNAAVTQDGWREAFRHHPRIGERTAERTQSDAARALSAREQSGVHGGADTNGMALADANRAYEERFGHVFIISASGRSSTEMLAALRERMNNDPATEIKTAAEEQQKITRLRLERLLG